MKKFFMIGLIGLMGLNSTHAMASKIVQVKGSDTIVNVSQYIAEEYMGKNKDARIAVTGGGSGVGISSLINGTADIGMASRSIKPKELEAAKAKGEEIKEVVLGYDGITAIVNQKNGIKNLTHQDLAKIFRGEITNWKQLGGDDATIVVLSRDSSSGTHEFFKEHIIREENTKKDAEYGEKTLYMPSNEAIKQEVKNNKYAIGYIGMGYVDNSVKSLSIDSVEPTVENVSTKKYPIAREVFWYVKNTDNKDVNNLVDFALSKDGQKIVADEGFVPVK
ncbi:phosphate ABC transporter substrate-binding protein [Cetobacterium sp. 8H]|uniref:phosphate ABC transporter substrate-binding protein n=1 Tax=Cetobacterium sp. 8H TaxID=2759681 RepID=UPI00163C6A8F|nr:phosphate ABC transporter substrate-binding protein [Cetobacterium sp. 8H]MBC2851326.1 phosphate ABC transporter substrate-binding protein [Cetobacterium sp. 8H]